MLFMTVFPGDATDRASVASSRKSVIIVTAALNTESVIELLTTAVVSVIQPYNNAYDTVGVKLTVYQIRRFIAVLP